MYMSRKEKNMLIYIYALFKPNTWKEGMFFWVTAGGRSPPAGARSWLTQGAVPSSLFYY